MTTKTEYREYIASEKWQRRRRDFLTENKFCEQCDCPRWLAVAMYDQDLHVHHVSYARVGSEEDGDLKPLCRRCHELETFGKTELSDAFENFWRTYYYQIIRSVGQKNQPAMSWPSQQWAGFLTMIEELGVSFCNSVLLAGRSRNNFSDCLLNAFAHIEADSLSDERVAEIRKDLDDKAISELKT